PRRRAAAGPDPRVRGRRRGAPRTGRRRARPVRPERLAAGRPPLRPRIPRATPGTSRSAPADAVGPASSIIAMATTAADTILTLDDVHAARETIAGRLHRTPTFSSRQLSEQTDATGYLKAEGFQRTGSFKPRGV